jgi:hypothetical protein
MSLQLLNHLNGNNNGKFATFLKNFNNDNQPRIAWYPSAAVDFKSLVYLSNNYSKHHPPLIPEIEPASPDLVILTDYNSSPNLEIGGFRTMTGFNNIEASYAISNIEVLPRLDLQLDPNLVNLPNAETGSVYFMEIEINSSIGNWSIPVIYAVVENTAFYLDVLYPNKAIISHIVRVRYGGGLGGGGKAGGSWIESTLINLNTELLISSNCNHTNGDDYVVENYQDRMGNIGEYESIREVNEVYWSNYGDITWNLINFDNI